MKDGDFYIQGTGSIKITDVLSRFEGHPTIAVAESKRGKKYICLNTDIGEDIWLVAVEPEYRLKDFALGKLSIGDMIEDVDKLFFIQRKINKVTKLTWAALPEDERPNAPEFRFMEEDRPAGYLKKIQQAAV